MEKFKKTVKPQDTIPAGMAHAEETERFPSSTAPQYENGQNGTVESENTSVGEGAEPVWSLPVVYNHENRSLTKDEATRYAQLGMKYSESGIDIDKIKPLYNKLDYLAAIADTTPDELVDRLISEFEDARCDEFYERYGESDLEMAEDITALCRKGLKDKYDRVVADRKEAEENEKAERETSLNTRLAEEFCEMRSEYPNITSFASLPEDVKRAAINGMNLEHAYLKYLYGETRKLTAANENARRAAEHSAGALSGEADTKSTDESHYLNALWKRQ